MNIKQRFISLLAALIFVLASGCSSVTPDSPAPIAKQQKEQAQEPAQEQEQDVESLNPSPSINGMEELKRKGSDDMERLD
jgi:PBP1b-binding outer membrane lipoprotein LpoB